MKKLLSVLLAVAMIFTLSACNKSKDDSSLDTQSKDENLQTPVVIPTESEKPEVDGYNTTEGMALEDIDFLTDEQLSLLDKSYIYHEAFSFETWMLPNSVSYGDVPYNELPRHIKDGDTYIFYDDSFYSSWEIFYEDYMTVFTEEYLMK